MIVKSKKRINVIDNILKEITDKQALDSIGYKKFDENRIKQSLQHLLVVAVNNIYIERNYKEANAKKAAYENVIWEGTPHQTIHNREYLGCSHRPDFEIKMDGLEIAIEIKRGEAGVDLRSGIGQALIYSQIYDFVIYLFVDTSGSQGIAKSFDSEDPANFIRLLWDNFNIRFFVI